MPCYDGREVTDRIETQRRLNAATRAACEALTALSAHASLVLVSQETRDWWRAHQSLDAQKTEGWSISFTQ